MSDRDNPFGSGGKTVIRPMPGGAPQQPAAWPAGQPGQGHDPRVNSTPQARPVNQPGMPGLPQDDWTRMAVPVRPNQMPQQAAEPAYSGPKIPLEVALSAEDRATVPSVNPIMAAAAPLLVLLGRLRMMIIDVQAVPLMTNVANKIQDFERKVLEAGVDPQDARIAKYALCGTADDIVQNLPGTDRHVWLQYSMLAQFFQVRTSGVGFYEELAKILQNPVPRYELLELMHACLSLGFEGQYRGTANGANDLQRVRRDVYQTLRRLRSRADDDLSPRWRGLNLKMANLHSRIPVWAVVSMLAVLLVGAFFLLRLLLGNNADMLSDRLIALHSGPQVTLERAAFTPAQIPDTRDQTQLERIRAALAEDIAAGGLTVDSVGDQIIVNVNNTLLFASGSAEVKPEFTDLGARIAQALQNEPGPISVIGHTDSVKPSNTSRFKSNHDLSVARAESVSAALAETLTDASRLLVEGRGELEPAADNGTAEGRAQNRRVEIMIPREETLI
jgi:type VI secretion system protein ImpK